MLACVVYATPKNRQKCKPVAAPAAATSAVQTLPSIDALKDIGTIRLVKSSSDSGSLYAGITAIEVLELLVSQHGVTAQSVDLALPIKSVGSYGIKVDGVDITLVVASV